MRVSGRGTRGVLIGHETASPGWTRRTSAAGVWRPVVASVMAAAGILTAGILAFSAPTAGAPSAIQLTATEFLYDPHDITASAGTVDFTVRNGGAIEHNFVLEDRAKKRRIEIPIMEPGQVLEVKALLQPGTYVIYCSLPGHKDAGMIAALHVQ